MALHRQLQIRRRHADAVIGDPDQAAAAAIHHHLDAACAGIERVLDQLLDDGGRPLDHLAGGDAVDHDGRQQADRHRDSGFKGEAAARLGRAERR